MITYTVENFNPSLSPLSMTKKIYQVADFVIDTQTRQLFSQGKLLPISSKAFDILGCLVENQGKLVEKSKLLDIVWPNTFVEESNLPVHISALRRTFDEKRGESKFIQTMSGRGYSFVAPLLELNSVPELTKNSFRPENVAGPISIAILPFTLEKDNEDLEYLSNGITQSLINDLSQISSLRVLAYSAVRNYRDSNLDIQEAGYLLNADKILRGQISEHKNTLEIGVELINSNNKTQIWGAQHSFDLDDVFRIKKEISISIADVLKLKLTESHRENFAQQRELDYEAQKLYFRGIAVLESRPTNRNLKAIHSQALNFFKQAIEIEPNYALAYTGVGMVYVSMLNLILCEKERASAEVWEALQMALRIDDRISQAYVLKGSVESMFDRNYEQSFMSLDRAIELNPSNPDAYHWKGFNFMCLGRFEESLAMEIKATEFDPISLRFSGQLMRIHYYSGNYQKSIVQAEELLEFNDKYMDAFFFLAMCYAQLGFFDKSLRYMEKAIELRPDPEIIAVKAYIAALMGDTSLAEEITTYLLGQFAEHDHDFTLMAMVASSLGKTELAFERLEKAFKAGSTQLCLLKVDVGFKNLRSDPRFDLLLRRLNLL